MDNPYKELWYEQRVKELEAKLKVATHNAGVFGHRVEELEVRLSKAMAFLDELRDEQCYDGHELVQLIKDLTGDSND